MGGLWNLRKWWNEIRLNDEGEFVVDDLISLDFVHPKRDVLQHVELVYATIDDRDRIQAVIRRRLDTCDKDDIAVSGTKQFLICASGMTSSVANKNEFLVLSRTDTALQSSRESCHGRAVAH